MSETFNFDKALADLQAGKDLTGKDGVLMPLIKQLTEAAITAELDPPDDSQALASIHQRRLVSPSFCRYLHPVRSGSSWHFSAIYRFQSNDRCVHRAEII